MGHTRGAIVRSAPGKYEVVDLELDEPRPGEIEVKMVASGLCHSDDHIATGDIPVGTYPFAGGHEGSGIVTRAGANKKGLKEGDHVVFSFLPSCGHCRWCASGMQNLCDLGAGLLAGTRWEEPTTRLRLADDGSAEPSLWQRLLADRFALERRMMLEARIERGDGVSATAAVRTRAPIAAADVDADGPHGALNDFYFRPCLDEVSPTCLLELEIDGEVVDQYRGDGLIIATPTGSTGYAMAAGGPILHPGIEAIVVNPICPMSLSSRAVVVPPRSRLTVWPLGESSRRVKLWKDGAHASLLDPGDRCVVQQGPHPALLLQLEQSPSYYRTLTHKLHWAGSLTNGEASSN